MRCLEASKFQPSHTCRQLHSSLKLVTSACNLNMTIGKSALASLRTHSDPARPRRVFVISGTAAITCMKAHLKSCTCEPKQQQHMQDMVDTISSEMAAAETFPIRGPSPLQRQTSFNPNIISIGSSSSCCSIFLNSATEALGPTAEDEEQIARLADNLRIEGWHFNALKSAKKKYGRNQLLPKVCLAAFDNLDLFNKLNPGGRLQLWGNLWQLDSLYRSSNSYHFALHAADVVGTLYAMMTLDAETLKLTPVEQAAMLYAAAAHDVRHTGYSNSFLEESGHPLAWFFGSSPAEKLSIATAEALLADHAFNFLQDMLPQHAKEFRRIMKGVILRTDMLYHSDSMTWAQGSSKQQLALIMHTADISNAAKPWHICKPWGKRIAHEFWREGLLRKALGLPVPSHLGKEVTPPNVAASQVYFIGQIASKTFEALKQLAPNTAALAAADCAANLSRYRAML